VETYDVVIIGSGISGSVAALLLGKLGYKALMVEKGTHPRFALGESSTPIMSKKIRNLGKVYDVPELIELSSYDYIMASKRPFLCGPKELFHYFVHQPNQTQAKINGRYPEIVVQTPEVDTQFLRSELDERLVEYAQKYGAEYIDMTELLDATFGDDGVQLQLQKKDAAPYEVKTRFLIDATGFRSLLSKKFDLRVPENELDTPLRSRCIFTHFQTVGRLEDAVGNDEIFNRRLKVSRLRATQHHCFDGGWYWFIPFDNGVTSVGVNLDMDRYPMNDTPAEEEFWQLTRQYPIVHSMLEGRKTLMPYIKTGRLQFRTRRAAGERWALLPAAATGGDAWFSTGLGMNLIAIHRLVEVLHTRVLPKNDFRASHFKQYEDQMFREWHYITRMIDGIYKSFKHYEVFKSYCFFCFMGAESYVKSGGIRRPNDPNALLLSTGNPQFVEHFERIYAKVLECNKKDRVSAEEAEFLRAYLQNEMQPYNFRDYGNPSYDGVHYRVSDDDDEHTAQPQYRSVALTH
jgi:tetracycline 7-halogenase / FADH2 O2-dependent halogenase